ncbi:hypothetical protein BDZ88DRAFT_504141 [Geranomyces variabilis]|nr:hypothetical protein BDZ88DRAFT_504141 [Geranomyces variabilis]KAJ3139512.1 hypothetical protein HDU90_009013 [Geranomyces variabilis]
MNSPQSDDVFAGQIRIMATMGFPDENINRAALHRTEGRINSAIDLIVSGEPLTPLAPGQQPEPLPSSSGLLSAFDPLARPGSGGNRSPQRSSAPSSPISPNNTPARKYRPLPVKEQQLLYQLHGMGFLKYGSKEEGKCRDALHRTKGNVDHAVALLLDSKDLNEDFDLISKPEPAPTPNGWTDLSALNGAAWPTSSSSPAAPSLAPPPSVRMAKSHEVLSDTRFRATPAQMYSPPRGPPPVSMHPVPRLQQPPPAVRVQVPEEDPFGDDFRI